MRSQQFFERLNQFGDFRKAKDFASQQIVNSGWEVWLQVEIAYAFKQTLSAGDSLVFEREKTYPGEARRCDFYLGIVNKTKKIEVDPTYIELKCINPYDGDPKASAIDRYYLDIEKALSVKPFVVCLLMYCGNWREINKGLIGKDEKYAPLLSYAVVYEIGNDGKFYKVDVDMYGHEGVFMYCLDIEPHL